MIHIEHNEHIILKDILLKYPYSFYIYGSRSKGDQLTFSDIDLCILDQTMSTEDLQNLKTDLEESDLPFTVDCNFWYKLDKQFQELIQGDLKLIQANNDFIRAESNLFSKFTFLPKILGYNILKQNSITVINCKVKTSMFNIACDANFVDSQVDENIQYVIDQYLGNPFAWWVGPSSTPNYLQKKLLESGLKKETDEYAMFRKLSDFREFELDKNISIRQVNNHKELLDFIKIISLYDEYVGEFLDNELIITHLTQKKNPMFVSYIDDEPVGIGALHFNNGIAGIYDIITPEIYRAKGIGTNIMKFLMNYAYREGAKDLCLSASSDSGLRIYEKLGFKIIGLFGCYEWYGK
jgi:ribosomal protein S18 acetylase RimI-like enzyme/predicted nucleotidyltransferase